MENISRRNFMGSMMAGSAVAAGTLLTAGAVTGCGNNNSAQQTTSAPQSGTMPVKEAPKGGAVLFTNAILVQGAADVNRKKTNVLVEDGIISKIGPTVTSENAEVYDCDGALLLPSFMDPHVHLDKTRIGAPRLHHPEVYSVPEWARNERNWRKELNHDPFVFGSNLVRQLALMGTTHIRSHVDVDDDVGLTYVEKILEVREKYKNHMDIQLVAFPQSGIIKAKPGMEQTMQKAIEMGVDIVGGLDPRTFDDDLDGHLDALFRISEKTGCPMDIHLHEPDQIGLATFKAIVERAKAHDMKNNITLSHAYALGMIPESDLTPLLEDFVEYGISVASSTSGDGGYPPVEALYDAGVLYAGMSDNIQDFWCPWFRGDQLERAWLFIYTNYFLADRLFDICYDMVTENPAKMMGIENHGLKHMKVGMVANLTAVHAEDLGYAILHQPKRLFTMREGQFLMRDGEIYMP